MVKRKQTKSAKVRSFIAANPNASAKYIAEQVNVPVQLVYNVQHKLRNPMPVSKPVSKPTVQEYMDKKAQAEVDKYWNAVGEVQKAALSPERIAELTAQAAKPKARMQSSDSVNRPAHYTDGGIETIDYIEAKGLGYHLGNAVKYISRAGKKGTNQGLEDLRKAQWYLARAIEKNEYASPNR